jgi:hypothetical protein
MSIYSIYRAKNIIDGKIYIGFDSNWPNRKKCHEKDSFNPKSVNHNNIFHTAIRQHGPECFEWDVIYQSKDANHTLHEMESHFIIS